MSATTIVPKQSLKRVVQRASPNAHLYRDLSNAQAPSVRSRKGHLDAIIVPASRPPSFLRAVIQMAASLDILLVVLASRQTDLERVAQRVARNSARSLPDYSNRGEAGLRGHSGQDVRSSI